MATQTWVNIGSGNGLLPDGTKPLPEPILTNHKWGLVAFTWEQFHRKCPRYLSLIWVWKIANSRFQLQLPGANELNDISTRLDIQISKCIVILSSDRCQILYAGQLVHLPCPQLHFNPRITCHCFIILFYDVVHYKYNVFLWNVFDTMNMCSALWILMSWY